MTGLTNLTDVQISNPQAGDILQNTDGTNWANVQPGAVSGIQPYNANTSITNVAETRSATIDMAGNALLNADLQNYSETVVSISAASTTNLDISQGNIFYLSQGADIATLNISNIAASGKSCDFTLIRKKDNTSTPRVIVWPSSFKWQDGTAPTLTQSANAIDTFEFVTTDGGVTWYGFASGLNMA